MRDKFWAALGSRKRSSRHFLAEPCWSLELQLTCFSSEGLDPNLSWSPAMSWVLARRSSSTPAQKARSVSRVTGITFQLVRLSCPATAHFLFRLMPSWANTSSTLAAGAGPAAGHGGGGGGGGAATPTASQNIKSDKTVILQTFRSTSHHRWRRGRGRGRGRGARRGRAGWWRGRRWGSSGPG